MKYILRLLLVFLVLSVLFVSCAPPVKRKLAPSEPFLLGAQFEGGLGNRDRWVVPDRLYHTSINWRTTETSPGIYTFPQHLYDTINRLNSKLGEGNYQLIIGVKISPEFYSSDPNFDMAPPRIEHADEFAKFIEQLVITFDPWGIEVWNEPEFPKESSVYPYFGGYGVYNGLMYGQTVRVIYDYLKSRQLQVKIIAGASLGTLNNNITTIFVSDAVGGGMKADYWSFHSYFWYKEFPSIQEWENIYTLSNAIYAIFPVPQIVSETSIMLPDAEPENPAHRDQQALYLNYLIRSVSHSHIVSLMWYALANNGWRHTDLVFNNIPYPAYDVWKNYGLKDPEIYLPIVIKP